MKLRHFVLLTFFCASSAVAQNVTMGNVLDWNDYVEAAGGTNVDLSSPATMDGTIVRAGFALGTMEDVCPDAVRIKFFRRDGDSLRLIAERGPLTWNSDRDMVPLTPPVEVLKGDLIGLTPPAGCGHLIATEGSGQFVEFDGDVTGTVAISSGRTKSGRLVVFAAGGNATTTVHTALILPVVGSTPGAEGSLWRTSLQLLNPYSTTAEGSLVFRPAGASGWFSGTSLRYSLAPGATRTYPDVLAAIGTTGLGSLDVVTDFSEEAGKPPVAVAHIYHVAGPGTEGFSYEALDPDDASYQCTAATGMMIRSNVLRKGVTGFLLAPSSLEQARFNIGMRTLAEGATLNVSVQSVTGEEIHTVMRQYPGTFFGQLPAEEFLDAELHGGESVRITVLEGAAIVYGTTTDNVTNDARMEYAYSHFRGETE